MTVPHPTELLFEYVIATLAPEQMSQIDAHLVECSQCRQLVHELRADIFQNHGVHARVQIKKQLFDIVAFDRDFGAVVRTARLADTLRWIAAVILVLVGSAFASIFLWNGYFARTQLSMDTVPTQVIQPYNNFAIADFMARDGIRTFPFQPKMSANDGTLVGYTQPNQPGILLVGRDMPLPDAGTNYVAWLRDNDTYAQLGVFAADEIGTIWMFQPDRQWCQGCEVIITRETSLQDARPSGSVLFEMVYSE